MYGGMNMTENELKGVLSNFKVIPYNATMKILMQNLENKKKEDVLYIVAGPNGSGKSTLIANMYKNGYLDNVRYINADMIGKTLFCHTSPIEKRNKKRLMALSDFLRSLLVMLLILFYMFQQLNVYIIMFTTFMISILETLRVPSSTPMIASLVPKEKYDIAQSLHTSLSKSLEIVGMGLAGILLNSFGIMITFIIDCLSFIVSGLMIGHIHFHDNSNIQKQSTISLLNCQIASAAPSSVSPYSANAFFCTCSGT